MPIWKKEAGNLSEAERAYSAVLGAGVKRKRTILSFTGRDLALAISTWREATWRARRASIEKHHRTPSASPRPSPATPDGGAISTFSDKKVGDVLTDSGRDSTTSLKTYRDSLAIGSAPRRGQTPPMLNGSAISRFPIAKWAMC